ncbi:MAG: DNA ligase D [Burkholderiales bacterium]
MTDPSRALLQGYRNKRDFTLTPEPQGATRARTGGLPFVVHKHAARHLHYDFRLALDGVLKSWAVPKGPSLDPTERRMAVAVEDHPLDYAGFEGVIPAGQYGAGTVIVWDQGHWMPVGDPLAGLAAGRLKFELHGHKLRGHWTLVRMRGRPDERQAAWLLIKERDDQARAVADYDVLVEQPDSVLLPAGPHPSAKAQARPKAQPALKAGAKAKAGKVARQASASAASTGLPALARPAALPLTLAPQLAVLVDRPPTSGAWRYELKFDGYRLLARIDAQGVRLLTRNGNDWTTKLRSLAREVAGLGLQQAWLDGEIVVAGNDGVPDFQRLQNAFEAGRTEAVTYHVFDLPYCDDHDLRAVPLSERRTLLRDRLSGAGASRVHFSEDFAAGPAELLHTACELRMEGLIGKRADAPYTSARSPDWIKLKCTQRQEFVIGGYTEPRGARTGLGALLVGVHDPAGRLRYAGKVGTGFDATRLQALRRQLDALQASGPPFDPAPPTDAGARADIHWVRPKLVAEISFAQWTRDGRIRHAVFHGLRSDKPPRAITRERAAEPASTSAAAAKRTSKPARKATLDAAVKPPSLRPPAWPAAVRLTHPDRVIDPSTGITKQELAQYYLAASRQMLPHLQRRPVALVRAPDGIGGALFFQKHGAQLAVPGLRRLDPALDPGHPPLLEVATLPALLGAVQMNVVEFHTWNATTRAIEQPDRMVFDLDPGEGVAWPRVQEAAVLVRALLVELGLQSWLKTSGGKGLHVVVPCKPALDWAPLKALSQRIVQHLAQTLPSHFVAKSGPRNRVGKVYADYLRNGRGATTAAAWSARARPGMGVSVPVAWDELDHLTSGAHWTVRTAVERLVLPDPWRADAKAAASAARQSLRAAMQALDFVPPSPGARQR